MSEAMRRYYSGEPSDVSITITDDDLRQNIPSEFAAWQDYTQHVIRAATPEGKTVGEMMITRCEDAPQYIVDLWLDEA